MSLLVWKRRADWRSGELVAWLVVVVVSVVWFGWVTRAGVGHAYYSGSARTLADNPRWWFSGAFDPGGFVTVDKPPVGLWATTIGLWLFGSGSVGFVLPGAVMGWLAGWFASRTLPNGPRVLVLLVVLVTPGVTVLARSSLPDATMLAAGCAAAAVLLAGTGTETDELIVDLLVSEVAPPLATETVVDVSCSDGSTFSEIVEVPGRAVLEPVAIGANCTATVSNGPGVAFDADQKRTKVFNFGINDDGIGQPGDAGGVEFGDLFFVVSAPAVEPPAASDDTAVAMVGEDPVFVDVLANDSDPNEDIDADSLMIVGLPTLGEVIVSGTAPSRGVLYSPVLGGDDSFVYQVCDAEGLCDTATVEVTVLEQSDCTIVGSEGPDVLIGTQGDDVICGMAGDDDIRGEAGDDLIFAGSGADVVRGGFGADVIVGGRGADLLIGGGGDDVIRGRRGNDTIRGNSGDDVLRGGRGQDDMSGGAGADLMFGGRHADVLRGGPGDDVLRGRAGTDSLFGNRGNDVLRGGPGYDYGDGGASADECIHVEVTVSCR